MAESENIGGVSVSIGGDFTPLLGDLKAVTPIAQKAGETLGSAISSGATAASSATSNLSTEITRLIEAIGQENAALALSIQRNLAYAGSANTAAQGARNFQAAAHGTVSEIQATSGALRVLEGSGGIRAAERFLTLIPGLGAFAQIAFPVVGAIALYDALDKVVEKSIDVKGALEALSEATKATDADFANLTKTIDKINVERQTRDFGGAAGLKLKSNLGATDAQADFDKAKAIYRQITDLKEEFRLNNGVNPAILIPKYGPDIIKEQAAILDKLREQAEGADAQGQAKSEEVLKDREDQFRTSARDEGSLSAARIENAIKTNSALATLSKTNAEIQISGEHAIAQAQINGIEDSHNRAVAEASEQVRVALETRDALSKISFDSAQRHIADIQAKAAADSAGRTPIEAQHIQVKASGEVSDLHAAQYQKETELQAAYLKALEAFDEAVATQQRYISELIVKEGEKRLTAVDKQVNAILAAAKRGREESAKVGEIEAKGKGESAGLAIEARRLDLERSYGLEISHTAQQQIEYARQLAELSAQARTAKVAGLQADLAIAASDYESEGHEAKVAEIEQQIAKLKQESSNASFAADTARLESLQKQNQLLQAQKVIAQAVATWQSIGVGTFIHDLANAAVQVPQALGSAIASGVFSGGRKGEDVGQQITKALAGIGKQLFGEIVTAAIQKLIAELAIHLLGVTLQTASQQAATVAITALTAAVIANTAAQATSAGVGAAGSAASAGASVAGAAASAGSSAASGLTGPLIAAAGGVIGGIISGVLSLIGDRAIVNAIHGTTAAVQALHGTVSGAGPGTPNTSTAPISKGFVDSLLAGISTRLFGSGAMDVNVVSISPIAFGAGLAHLFGFAAGTNSAPGGWSMIGEKGPEAMFVPRGAQIVPNHKLDSIGVQSGSGSPGWQSSGTKFAGVSIGAMSFNVHGVTNPDAFTQHVMRTLPLALRSKGIGTGS